MVVKIQTPDDLPRDALNALAIEAFDHLAAGQHQAARPRISLVQHHTDKGNVPALAEFAEDFLIEGVPGIGASDKRH
jgi:hypothetical protein